MRMKNSEKGEAMKINKVVPLVAGVLILSSFLVMCSSTNRLREYEFHGKRAGAIMAVAPPPEVFTDSFFYFDEKDPLGSVLRIGTTIVKHVELRKARERMLYALEEVDIPEALKDQTLTRCERILRYRPEDNPDIADYLFEMNIVKYGIVADSWSAGVHFLLDAKVYLVENVRNVEIWRKRVKERLAVTEEVFGIGSTGGNVITAIMLSTLTEEQMIEGFENLAEYAADQLSRKLLRDVRRARTR